MRILAKIVAAGLSAAAAGISAAQAADAAAKPAASLEELTGRLVKIFEAGKVPGAQLAVVEHGKVVLLKSYGVADTARKTPVTDDTVFRAGSISKTVTSIAVMTLVEQKKLDLNGRLAELAPEVHFVNPWEKTDPVRLVHLLEHTTGWPDVSTRVLAQEGKGWSTLKGVQFTMDEFTSRWAPGRFAVYNNAGPAVAGVILEQASGQAFGDYVNAHVLRPMGMPTADFDLTADLAKRIAKSYAPDGSETPFQDIVLPPAGSLNVNARELVQLVRFYLGRGTIDGKQILSPASVDRLERSESNLASKDGFTQGYALGNAPFPEAGIGFRGHNGEIDSFTAVFGYRADCGCGYVLMANGGEGVNFGAPAALEIEHYLTRGMTMTPPPAVAVPDAELQNYAGIYRVVTPPGNLLKPLIDVAGFQQIAAGPGKLVVSGNDFVPTARHIFRRTDRDRASIAFAQEDGEVYKLTAFNASVKEPLWRVVVVFAVLGAIALGAVFGAVMTIPWLVGGFRGRLTERGGWMVRFAPLLSILCLVAALGMTMYVVLGSGTSALRLLAEVGPYSVTIFVLTLLYPLLAALGLWLALTRKAPAIVRLYAAITCAGMLAFSAYALPIGWVGARVWAM
ncbi:MAG: beta-lactamase family protein [Alphaproteobacteria bacterium]|nr:beta-lactamase family protein [Alphaproteobacteria bacterium]